MSFCAYRRNTPLSHGLNSLIMFSKVALSRFTHMNDEKSVKAAHEFTT